MIRKIGAALVIAAGALAATGMATPAFAAQGDRVANLGEVVLWQNASFSGPLYDYSTTKDCYPNATSDTVTPDESFKVTGPPVSRTKINDNTSSIANYSAGSVLAFTDCTFQGVSIELLPYGTANGSGLSWAYSSLGTFNESLSSHRPA